jgi:neutral ceramidase
MKTFFALLICAALVPSRGELRGGLARVDITPTKPVKLAGYAARVDLSKDVHDPLSARAIAFESGGKRLLIISTDNLGWYNNTAEAIRKAILQETKLQPSELLLAAIHTHSAPTLTFEAEKAHANNVEYTRELQAKLVSVAKAALEKLEPVNVAFGRGYSPVGVNRREVTRDTNGAPRIVLGRNPHTPIDREVQVLKVTRAGGDLAGVFFAFATHSTSLGTRNYSVSGDVHGLAAQFVEKYFGDKVVVPEFAGASGNIDPWYRVLPSFNTTNNWVPEPVLLGTMLGEEVVTVANQIRERDASTNLVIKSAIKTVNLQRKPREQVEAAATESNAPIVVTVAAVGEIAFVGLGGEVFNEIGQAIKKASPFAQTIVITHCNGAAGYLPISSAYGEGGYEVTSSPFAPGSDERLIREVGAMLKELR